jgi:hypothetical protein
VDHRETKDLLVQVELLVERDLKDRRDPKAFLSLRLLTIQVVEKLQELHIMVPQQELFLIIQ